MSSFVAKGALQKQLKILRWEKILDYRGGPNSNSEILGYERSEVRELASKEGVHQDSSGCGWLGRWKKVMSLGTQQPLEGGEGHERDSSNSL